MTTHRSLMRRAISALLLALCLLVTSLPDVARAEPTRPRLTTKITDISFTGAGPERRVVLEGTVVNESQTAVFTVQSIIWFDSRPLQNVQQLRDTLKDPESGARHVSKDENFARITPPGGEFAAGSTSVFKVSAKLSQLGIQEGQAYAVGVQTRASLDGRSVFETLGEDRTAVAFPKADDKVPVTPVVLLTATPGMIEPGVFIDDSLAAELRGRLRTFLQTAKEQRAAVLVDPSLLAEVQAMANGYAVATEEETTPGTNRAVAKEWLALLNSLPSNDVQTTLFGVPEVKTVSEAAGWSQTVSGDKVLAYFGSGQATKNSLTALAAHQNPIVIATNTSSDEPVQNGPAKVLRASEYLINPMTAKTASLLDAEALILGSKGQLRVITKQDQLSTLKLRKWMEHRPLKELVEAKPSVDVHLRSMSTPKLEPDYWKIAQSLEPDLAAFQLASPVDVSEVHDYRMAQLASSSWVEPGPKAKVFLDGLKREYGGIKFGARVRITAASRFVMSSKSTEFPISITNTLAHPVRVKVKISVENPQRLSLPDSGFLTVNAGETGTVNIHPEAESNGIYQATAQLVTESGEAIGQPANLQIEATDLTLVGWVIILVAAAVLVMTVVWRIRKVRS